MYSLRKLTPFGLCVKTTLMARGLEQQWLEQEITKQTGLYMDSSYMYKILTGQRTPESVITAICDILGIPPGTQDITDSVPLTSHFMGNLEKKGASTGIENG